MENEYTYFNDCYCSFADNVDIFSGTITLPKQETPKRPQESLKENFVHNSDKSHMELDETKWRKTKVHENEVYPKDAPYTSAGSELSVPYSITLALLISLFILQH